MISDPEYYRICKRVLSESRLFEGLPDTMLGNMLSMFRRDTWRRGAQLNPAIFQERFFLLIEGRLEVMSINPQTGRSITLFLLGPGDGFDVVPLLDNKPHVISPVALDDVALISVPIQQARQWIDRHPEYNRNFLGYLGAQMRQIEDLATDLALYDTMARLARLILRHVIPHYPHSAGSRHQLRLINDLHDEPLARMVGSVRQVVNRHLQLWRKQGILQKKHFLTEVSELETLQKCASAELPHEARKDQVHSVHI